MKCTIDQTEMEKGWLANGRWVIGPMENLSVLIRPMPPLTVKSLPAAAWKCPKCNKIEIYVEEEK